MLPPGCPKRIHNAEGLRRSVTGSIQSFSFPTRVMADTISRTRENVQYCKSQHFHLNDPKLERSIRDPEVRKAELLLEWLESGERGDIERRIGTGKLTRFLGLITAKFEHTSEVMTFTSGLTVNLS